MNYEMNTFILLIFRYTYHTHTIYNIKELITFTTPGAVPATNFATLYKHPASSL